MEQVKCYTVGMVIGTLSYQVEQEEEAKARAQQESFCLSSGMAYCTDATKLLPTVIYVDGWPYYPAVKPG